MSGYAKHNHYVPQFYMRQFSCADDEAKVKTMSRHDPYIVTGRKSIVNIGYEDELHIVRFNKRTVSAEESINKFIETPFARSATWKKIQEARPHDLNLSDKLNLYLFIRHLQFRNLENLSFLEQEVEQIKKYGFPDDYSLEEREARDYIFKSLAGAKGYFLNLASGLSQFMGRWREASITVLTSKSRLRTSTNPVLPLPLTLVNSSLYDFLDPDDFVYWLPLAPYFGIRLTLSRRFCDFKHFEIDDDVVRALNRLYLVQMNTSLSVRHCIADDAFIQDDLSWANYKFFDGRNEKMRFKRQG